jgi:GTP-binding protein LepA
VPHPKGAAEAPLRALIFDSHYDSYKGVIAYVRVFEGQIHHRNLFHLMATNISGEAIEIGTFSPQMAPTGELSAGEVGYVATGLKTVQECHVGDTLTLAERPAAEPWPGYQKVKPMVFAGVYPVEGEDYADLKEALEKLQLNDASLTYAPETSQALNFGFRCGFLGLFHMEIVQERLEREYDLDIIATAPSVEYRLVLTSGEELVIDSPADLPDEEKIQTIGEPWMRIQIFTPEAYYGTVMELVTKRRGVYVEQEYPAPGRVLLTFDIPLGEMIVDFYDQLKSRTKGYASLDYQFHGYRDADLVKLEILVNEEPVDALAMIVHRDLAYNTGQRLVTKLKDLIPRQQFQVPVQASAGGRVISRANVRGMRKDVLAKCYGGDISRKKKLLEKQKRGKSRMKKVGAVEIPQDAFMAILRLGDD